MKRNAIVFDCDDTLFDYFASEKTAVKVACQKQGILFSSEVYNHYRAASIIAKRSTVDYMLNLSEFRRIRVAEFFQQLGFSGNRDLFIQDYLEASKDGILLPEVLETIKDLHNLFVLIVATNGSDIPRKNKLQTSSINSYFDHFFSSEYLKIAKPDKLFFEKILEETGLSPCNAISVGDSYETDVCSAMDAGMRAVWFNWKAKNSVHSNNKLFLGEIQSFSKLLPLLREFA